MIQTEFDQLIKLSDSWAARSKRLRSEADLLHKPEQSIEDIRRAVKLIGESTVIQTCLNELLRVLNEIKPTGTSILPGGNK